MEKKATPKYRLQPSIPVPVYEALLKETEMQDLSMNQLVTRILKDWLKGRTNKNSVAEITHLEG